MINPIGSRKSELNRTQKEITAELIETCLDRVAHAIEGDEERGHVYLPIFERLEQELDNLRAQQGALARVRNRLRQSKDRTAEQFF